ncbi:MAG: hypothetical protein QM723_14760 [Myxococcaceae bacterium]
MDDKVKALCVRLVETAGGKPDADWFTEDEAWAFFYQLVQMDQEGRMLGPASVQVLLDLGLACGLKPGAKDHGIMPAFEDQFGLCPFDDETKELIVKAVRKTANGLFEGQARPDNRLTGNSAGPVVPLKNYDYS